MTSAEEWCVYKHTAPNGKIYIGVTHMKPKYRWGRNGYGYRSNIHFYAAIKKYGWENITHEVLFSGLTQIEADQKERELIAFYNSANKKFGYNVALGGHTHSPESRKKIGDTRKARHIETWDKGKHLSEETRKKISEAHKGKTGYKWTPEQKELASIAKRGEKNPNYEKPMREASRVALLKAHEVPVIKIDGATETCYRSAKIAGDMNGVDNCNITRCCKGQRATAGGYKWRYANT